MVCYGYTFLRKNNKFLQKKDLTYDQNTERQRRISVVKAYETNAVKEALIKSLSAFILGFLCNARNGTTRIASYLRGPMTKQCIKILIKADSMN